MGTKYRNDDIRTAITQNTKLDGYSGVVPSEIEGKIQLNVDVTPNNNRYINVIHLAIGSDILILDATKDFYVTNMYSSNSSAGAGQNNTDLITAFINGIATDILINSTVTGITTDCSTNAININLKCPLKIDTGSTITFTMTSDGSMGLYGYYVDTQIYDTAVDKTPLTIK